MATRSKIATKAAATLLLTPDELSAQGSSVGQRRFPSRLRIAGAVVLGILIAGCSSQPKYPKQIITVLPAPPESAAAGQYPPTQGPSALSPEVPPQIPGQPVYPQIPRLAPGEAGEVRPQVPAESAPPIGAPAESTPPRTMAIPGISHQSHYNQGVLLFRNGDVDGAMAQFRLAVAQNPGDIKARDNLGVLLAQTGDSRGAIQQYQAALQTDPNSELTHRLLARAYAQSGDIDDAIDQYETTVKLDPNNAGAHNDFGVALHLRGNDNDAIYQYRHALALDPRDFAAHRNLADALNETNHTTEAIKELRIASGLKPDDLAIHNALGNLLFEQNDLTGAIAQWQTANKIDPRNPDALAGLSIGYWKMGLKRQALDTYRQAVALAPGYLCDDARLRGRGHWNGPTLNALHDLAKEPGAPSCSGT